MNEPKLYKLELNAGKVAMGILIMFVQKESIKKNELVNKILKDITEEYLTNVIDDPVLFEMGFKVMERELDEIIESYLRENSIILGREGMN